MAKKRLVKIALGQFESIQGDTQANLNKMLSMTDQAAEAGADLIVFPELAYSGYFCPSYQMQQLAEPKDGPFVQQMCKKDASTSLPVIQRQRMYLEKCTTQRFSSMMTAR